MAGYSIQRGSVDAYLLEGCGRCEHFKSPACKVHRFRPALEALRELSLAAGLDETVKWGSPCYTLGGANVAMIAALKERCVLSFFRGALLTDDAGILESPGPNSRHARWLVFADREAVLARRADIERFLRQAIELEHAGTKVARQAPEPVPEELEALFAERPDARTAFAALAPGRRRSHILHVLGAKQAATRSRRAEATLLDILAGRGFREADKPTRGRTPTTQPDASPVEAYLAAQPEPARSRLSTLRAMLRELIPDAEEKLTYGLPTWSRGGVLLHLGGFKGHVGVYPGPEAIEAFASQLEGFTTSKGAIQLPHERPLPVSLVKSIAEWRLTSLAGTRQPKAGSKRPRTAP